MLNVSRLMLFTFEFFLTLSSYNRVNAFHQILRRILEVRSALNVNINWREYCCFKYEYIKIDCIADSWNGGGRDISRNLINVKSLTSFLGLCLCLIYRKVMIVTLREASS